MSTYDKSQFHPGPNTINSEQPAAEAILYPLPIVLLASPRARAVFLANVDGQNLNTFAGPQAYMALKVFVDTGSISAQKYKSFFLLI